MDSSQDTEEEEEEEEEAESIKMYLGNCQREQNKLVK